MSDDMRPRTMILPNVLLLAGAAILFHRSFLSGHITRVGLLVVLSAALPLACYVCGRAWPPLRIAAGLLNAALFAMAAYTFAGTVYILARAGMLGAGFYLLSAAFWLAAAGVILAGEGKRQILPGLLLNASMGIAGALALYVRGASRWLPWMNAAFLAAITAIALLNAYILLVLPVLRRRKRPNESGA